jgi:tight adherence protein B
MGGGIYNLSIGLAAAFGLLSLLSVFRDLVTQDRERLKERIDGQLNSRGIERSRNSVIRQLTPREMQRILSQDKIAWYQLDALHNLVEQAGLSLAPTVILWCSLGGFLLGAVPGYLFLPRLWQALVTGLLLGGIPLFWLIKRRQRREEALRVQLADVFELMSSTLRAGQSIAESMRAVSQDFPAPVAEEFLLCSEQQNLGLDPEIALRQLAARNRIPELKTFVVALLVQKSSGGNLADILQTLSRLVRERHRMVGEIDSLTAEARLQAWILMALPPFLMGTMMVLNPQYAESLLGMPELLQIVGLGMLIGGISIRQIIRLDN